MVLEYCILSLYGGLKYLCNEENTSKILFRSTNALFFFFLFALLVASTITASPLFMGSKIALPIQKAYSISSATAPHTQLPSPPHSSTTTAHGTLDPISSTGSFSASVTYTPKKHYIGTDSFWFKVRDSVTHKASSAAYVRITVS
jgi:hypothetical protein